MLCQKNDVRFGSRAAVRDRQHPAKTGRSTCCSEKARIFLDNGLITSLADIVLKHDWLSCRPRRLRARQGVGIVSVEKG